MNPLINVNNFHRLDLNLIRHIILLKSNFKILCPKYLQLICKDYKKNTAMEMPALIIFECFNFRSEAETVFSKSR
jgi:hypothetical protein